MALNSVSIEGRYVIQFNDDGKGDITDHNADKATGVGGDVGSHNNDPHKRAYFAHHKENHIKIN
jgi:hypothetical protein